MTSEPGNIALSEQELREVAGYAAKCAQAALAIFESERPGDTRPRDAIDAANAFARGGRRTGALRDNAWAALEASRETTTEAAREAARAASHAAAAAYLHPKASSHQVKHILGAAAHAARAAELLSGDDRDVGAEHVERARRHATSIVVFVLDRFPAAPRGGGRVGELLRELDGRLRG
ncbi:exonuclease SbcC [Pyxidicoccus fallax]|uniref:Exonuclease SbcC n=2 Tax=Pyxidicoccus fallax TaxID=394095 RepID=A0A848LFZ8_9BACT|nr:exonuclease SbcC [Pyxidicoccus fallax]NPC79945.1 exonuclease SbcC [Pyxidicoccus fallax]